MIEDDDRSARGRPGVFAGTSVRLVLLTLCAALCVHSALAWPAASMLSLARASLARAEAEEERSAIKLGRRRGGCQRAAPCRIRTRLQHTTRKRKPRPPVPHPPPSHSPRRTELERCTTRRLTLASRAIR